MAYLEPNEEKRREKRRKYGWREKKQLVQRIKHAVVSS